MNHTTSPCQGECQGEKRLKVRGLHSTLFTVKCRKNGGIRLSLFGNHNKNSDKIKLLMDAKMLNGRK